MGKNAALVIAKGLIDNKESVVTVRKENGKLSFATNGSYEEWTRKKFEWCGAFKERCSLGLNLQANTLYNCIDILKTRFFDVGCKPEITVIGDIDEKLPRMEYI